MKSYEERCHATLGLSARSAFYRFSKMMTPPVLKTLVVTVALTVPTFAEYPDVVLADKPLLYYRFEGDAGAGSVQDFSGNGNDSEDLFGVILGVEGAVGSAANFEGAGSILTPLLMDPSETDFSIELLVNPNVVVGTQVIVSNQDGGGVGRSNLLLGPDATVRSFIGGNTTATELIVEPETWYHVILTYDNDGEDETIRIYVDGEFSTSSSLVVENAKGGWVVGSHKSQGSQFTNSILDEIAIYNYRLDDPNGDGDENDSKVAAHYGAFLDPPSSRAFEITSITYDGSNKASITWTSQPGRSYGIDSSTDLQNWLEIADSVLASDSEITTFDDEEASPGKAYYRVRQEE